MTNLADLPVYPEVIREIDFGEWGAARCRVAYEYGDDSDERGKSTYLHIKAIYPENDPTDCLPLFRLLFGEEAVSNYADVIRASLEWEARAELFREI